MSGEYSSHGDYMRKVSKVADERCADVETAFRQAFQQFIETRRVEVIVFSSITATDLGSIIHHHPMVVKAILAICNIAGRAIERDLSIKNVDTYKPRLTLEQSNALAGYIKPFLPASMEIPALCRVDRMSFIDKEIRKGKGRWEGSILEALNRFSSLHFKKRLFEVHGDKFELDAATPIQGRIEVGIDVKRIEARRDIHKRADEIVNKAAKLKSVYPAARFAAVIYYPFIEEHINVQNRLRSANIDATVFAGESDESVQDAIRLLLATLGAQK